MKTSTENIFDICSNIKNDTKSLNDLLNGKKNEKKGTILIVDDDIYQLKSLRFMLNEYHVITAKSGEEALKLIKIYQNLNIVIMDIRMPNMDGFQLHKEIRKFSKVPTVFLTAYQDAYEKMNDIKKEYDVLDIVIKASDNEDLMIKKLIEKACNK